MLNEITLNKRLKELLDSERKEIASLGIVDGARINEHLISVSREFLQIEVLNFLYNGNKGFEKDFIFMGGTALRLLHGIDRYSEDLDFSFHNFEEYKEELLNERISEMKLYFGGVLEVKAKVNNTNVRKIELKFGPLKDCGLFPVVSQRLMIKFEYDINPPDHGNIDFNSLLGSSITTFDKSTLKTGKFAASILRSYVKGRDFFDSDVYLNREDFKDIELNVDYFNSILEQNSHNIDSFGENELSSLEKVNSEEEIIRLLSDRIEEISKDETKRESLKKDLDKFVLLNSREKSDKMLDRITSRIETFLLEEDFFSSEAFNNLSLSLENENKVLEIEENLKTLSKYTKEGKEKEITILGRSFLSLNSNLKREISKQHQIKLSEVEKYRFAEIDKGKIKRLFIDREELKEFLIKLI